MDPRPSGMRPVFATRSPPGYHAHHQRDLVAVAVSPSHGRVSHLQDALTIDQQKNGSRRIKGLDVIQIASTNPIPRCRYLDSQMVLEEITFWTNVCNMWLLHNKQEQPDYAEERRGGGGGGGGGSMMMDSNSQVPYYSNTNHGPLAAPIDHHTARNQPFLHPHPTTHTTIHSSGVEAIHAALHRHNVYDEFISPISIAAPAGPLPQQQQPYHLHPSFPSSSTSPGGGMIQSTRGRSTAAAAAAAAAPVVADYKNNPYATMPRRGGRRDWRGQVPRPAGLQTRAEREFNGVDVYGRYKPE